jgi:aldose sugar dehydrogenase
MRHPISHIAIFGAAGLALTLPFAACAQTAATAEGAPVQTPPPNVPEQEPAFPGQTRAPEQISGVTLEQEEVVSGLEHPWAIEFLPDGRMLVTERPGRLRIVSEEGELSEPVEGLPEVDARRQGGLLDVVLGPEFAQDRMLYWSYTEPRGGGRNGTAVARGGLSDDGSRVEDVEVIFQQMPAWDSTLHFGSRLVWDREGRLYVTLGERSLPEPRQLAQDLGTHLGKVVRVNADGSAPDDNPFVDRDGALPEIWSYGHRNIQGAALHPETGELWTIEHGPKGGDELNRPEAGLNYGWPVITYGEEYRGGPIGEGKTAQEGMEQPLYYWDPVIAPGGMLFYEGDLFADWQGDLLVSSLQPGALVRLELDGLRVTGEERLLTDVGRVRDVAEGPDGALWVITDEGDGRLLKLTPGS